MIKLVLKLNITTLDFTQYGKGQDNSIAEDKYKSLEKNTKFNFFIY